MPDILEAFDKLVVGSGAPQLCPDLVQCSISSGCVACSGSEVDIDQLGSELTGVTQSFPDRGDPITMGYKYLYIPYQVR